MPENTREKALETRHQRAYNMTMFINFDPFVAINLLQIDHLSLTHTLLTQILYILNVYERKCSAFHA